MTHRVAGGGWTRALDYQESSLIEDGQATPRKFSNRLSRTMVEPGSSPPVSEPYTYDVHGNITSMSHLPLMQWDFRDRLRATSTQVTHTCMPETTFYVYANSVPGGACGRLPIGTGARGERNESTSAASKFIGRTTAPARRLRLSARRSTSWMTSRSFAW